MLRPPVSAGPRSRSIRRLRDAAFLTVCLAGGATVSACNPDIFDISVALTKESYPVDFGATTGTVPSFQCDPTNATACGDSQTVPLGNDMGQVTVSLGCDATTDLCYAQADARVTTTVDVLQDDSFTSSVGRRAVSVVRMLDLAYTIPVNTTTFEIPKIDVYVGPSGTMKSSDPGVYLVDSITSLPAGTTVIDPPRHLTVTDGSPARDLMETNIRNKAPFVFLVTTTPRLEAGSPLPAGMVEIDVAPLLGLGLR
jgi:hypothetical protein